MRAGLAPDQARELVREERAFLPSSGCDFDALGRTVKRQTDQVTGSARGLRRGTLVRASSGRQPALTDDHDAVRVVSRAGHPFLVRLPCVGRAASPSSQAMQVGQVGSASIVVVSHQRRRQPVLPGEPTARLGPQELDVEAMRGGLGETRLTD